MFILRLIKAQRGINVNPDKHFLNSRLTEFTDPEGVLAFLEKAIGLMREGAKQPLRVFTLRKLIAEKGIDRLRT